MSFFSSLHTSGVSRALVRFFREFQLPASLLAPFGCLRMAGAFSLRPSFCAPSPLHFINDNIGGVLWTLPVAEGCSPGTPPLVRRPFPACGKAALQPRF